jgi:CubicO group peptidase (beta-lactamase class C family)
MRFKHVLLTLMVPVALHAQRVTAPYVPGTVWERREAAQVGMNADGIAAAVAVAKERESRTPRDLEEAHYQTFGREPFGNAVGPFQARGDATGLIVRNGYIVAEWGQPLRADMTFSVTKSFVSTMVGLAVDRGLIRSIDDTVQHVMAPVLHAAPPALAAEGGRGKFDARTTIAPFDTPHNRTITWRHLLQQASDFEGTLWGKPEWADRPSQQPATWWTRERVAAGTVHEYNDTRVNALALAALNVWRRPLPEVLRELVMDPINASASWRWYGYDNSWVVLDGQLIQSVSGGGHWGGGMFISAYDQARFGLLTCRGGRWGTKQVIPESWIRLSRTPSGPNPNYGFMNYYLNTAKKQWPNAPESAFMHLGNGTNAVICLPEQDIVIVARWIQNGAIDEMIAKVLGAVR